MVAKDTGEALNIKYNQFKFTRFVFKVRMYSKNLKDEIHTLDPESMVGFCPCNLDGFTEKAEKSPAFYFSNENDGENPMGQ